MNPLLQILDLQSQGYVTEAADGVVVLGVGSKGP